MSNWRPRNVAALFVGNERCRIVAQHASFSSFGYDLERTTPFRQEGVDIVERRERSRHFTNYVLFYIHQRNYVDTFGKCSRTEGEPQDNNVHKKRRRSIDELKQLAHAHTSNPMVLSND